MSYYQRFVAHDTFGQGLSFAIDFVLRKRISGEYVDIGKHEIYPDGYVRLLLESAAYYEAEASLPDGSPAGWIAPAPERWHGCGADECTLIFVFLQEVALAFVDVAISRRYGRRLYLSGAINHILEADEICVYYSRPGDTGIRNLKSDTSDYLYFKDASGSYDLGANNRYIEFERAGYHWLQIWDVSGNCETLLTKRAEWLMNVILPRFQYEVIFDLANPDIVDSLYLLQAEYAKYEAAGSWFINHEEPDCFTQVQPINTPEDDTPQSGWLSLGVEFGESPCAPIPYYLCPLPTPQTQYWRGECSCDLFRDTLQPLGIPCSHLIAAMNWYSGEPAWSDYVKCP